MLFNLKHCINFNSPSITIAYEKNNCRNVLSFFIDFKLPPEALSVVTAKNAKLEEIIR